MSRYDRGRGQEAVARRMRMGGLCQALGLYGHFRRSMSLDGEVMQYGRTSQMIFGVGTLVEHLSGILELSPGDVIFTGTPSGVGAARIPQRFVEVGETLVSQIDGIGEIRQHFVAADR